MKTHRKKEWFDNEAFWRDLGPLLFPEQRFSDAAAEADKVLKLVRPGGKRVLDLCCGPGRWAIPFAQRGFQVTGVDRTKSLLDQARTKARAAHVRIEWIQQDMRDFVRPDSFDLLLSMYTSFGYFDDKRQDLTVLENMFTSLRPGGWLLMDLAGKEILARIFQPTTSVALADGTRIVQRHEVFDNWTRVRNEWILIRRGRSKTFHFHHTIYSGQELRERLERVGFAGVSLYGSLDGTEYGVNASRLIAVARKPKGRVPSLDDLGAFCNPGKAFL